MAGNYNPEMAPDVEMKLSFPKQGNASTGSQALASASNRRTNHPVGNPSGPETSHQSSAIAGNRKQYIEEAHHIPGRGYAGVQDDDSYGGVNRGTARAALPPSTGLNPKRTLSRSDGTGNMIGLLVFDLTF